MLATGSLSATPDVLRSVQSRVTAIAVISTLVALSLAAAALLVVLQQGLLDEIDTTITNRAIDIAGGIDISNELDNASFPVDAETFVGVLEFEGSAPVLYIHNDLEPNANELAQLLTNQSPSERYETPFDAALPSLEFTVGGDNMRLVFAEVTTGDEVIAVARSLDGIERSIGRIRSFALLAVPVLTLLIGLLVWLLVGRALRSVEQMRREVESITGSDLRRRVVEDDQPTEIGRLATTMNSMLVRLEESQERQRRFAGDAAHELRSPLSSIMAQLDVDALHPDDADPVATAASVRSEAQRLTGVVEDLLLLARAEGADGSSHRLLDIDDVVRVGVESVDRGDKKLVLSASTGAVVRGEERHLQRVVTNLVSNALRHARSTIEVSVSVEGTRLVIAVEDDGDGVALADRERIFDRFVRLDEARARDGGGSGLGLALAKEIVLQHGGSLDVDDSSAGGARFLVGLPIH